MNYQPKATALYICPKCHAMSLLADGEVHVCLEGEGYTE